MSLSLTVTYSMFISGKMTIVDDENVINITLMEGGGDKCPVAN